MLITVAHDNLRKLKKNYFMGLLKDKNRGVIFDIKNIFNEKRFISL